MRASEGMVARDKSGRAGAHPLYRAWEKGEELGVHSKQKASLRKVINRGVTSSDFCLKRIALVGGKTIRQVGRPLRRAAQLSGGR